MLQKSGEVCGQAAGLKTIECSVETPTFRGPGGSQTMTQG